MKTKKLTLLVALLIGFLCSVRAGSMGDSGNYVYTNQNLHVQITMPADWQEKMKVTETDQVITFSYINPGGQPVFLYSVTKISEQNWMAIKDQLTNVHIVAEKDGTVYFVELTDKTSIKSANAKEFKAIVDQLDEIWHSIKTE